MNKISVVIHTYNNEEIIRQCLESVKDFDEIVICDMYSTDNTLKIAREYNCKIVMHEKIPIVEPARNFAIQQASYDWVLIVDSDEIIPKDLKNFLYEFIEKQEKCEEKNYKAVKIPRVNIYWGFENEAAYPDYVLRFTKKSDINWPQTIHSQPEINGEIYTISHKEKNLAFIHHTCNSISQFINTINKYTDFELEKLIKKNKKFNMIFAVRKSLFLIIEKFILKRGYKNGIDGLLYCIFCGFYKFVIYAKYYVYLKNKELN